MEFQMDDVLPWSMSGKTTPTHTLCPSSYLALRPLICDKSAPKILAGASVYIDLYITWVLVLI